MYLQTDILKEAERKLIILVKEYLLTLTQLKIYILRFELTPIMLMTETELIIQVKLRKEYWIRLKMVIWQVLQKTI